MSEPRTDTGRRFCERHRDGVDAKLAGVDACPPWHFDDAPTWRQPLPSEPGGRRNPTYRTECTECGTPLIVTNNYSPQGDFLDQSIEAEAASPAALDVERLYRAIEAVTQEWDDQNDEPTVVFAGSQYDLRERIATEYARLAQQDGTGE